MSFRHDFNGSFFVGEAFRLPNGLMIWMFGRGDPSPTVKHDYVSKALSALCPMSRRQYALSK